MTLLFVALTLGLEFAHVLEWGPKMSYSGQLYVRLQESLYVWFGYLGSVIDILAILSTAVLAISLRGYRRVRWYTASAAGLEMIALTVSFVVIYPVNQHFPVHSSGTVPTDWTSLRDRWELGHTIGFVLFTISLLLLATALVRPNLPSLTPAPSDPRQPRHQHLDRSRGNSDS